MGKIRYAVLPATLLSFLVPAFVYADNITPPGSNTGGEYKLKKKYKKDPWHPQMPSNVFIRANLEKGMLTVEFPADAETAVVTIGAGDFAVFSAGIDRAYPCVELPPLSGDFLLSVTFDNGDTYEEEIPFN